MSEAIASPFRSDCLKGKVALVTGGGSGICFEVTRQLFLHGLKGAVICGRREKFLKNACDIIRKETGGDCRYSVCDVRDYESCHRAVESCCSFFGKLDILVNGAAGNFLSQAKDLTAKGFATVLAIDTQGTFNMSRAAHAALSGNGGDALIVNISATLQCPATHWQVHASAAKAAVDSMTRSLALEWGPDSIRVVGLAPGPIANTPGTTKLAPGMTQDEQNDLLKEGIPLGRMGEAFEIGHGVVYLATAKYVTGDILIIDGGQWLYKEPWVPREMVSELSRNVEAKSRAQAPKSRL